jgi:hypothetical protein
MRDNFSGGAHRVKLAACGFPRKFDVVEVAERSLGPDATKSVRDKIFP